MDLVSSVRKEGSRGGRSEFKWSDVKDSVHRENYLGHSVMAPVGRWQQNRDLGWYAKGEEGEEERLRQEREELQRVKDAEEEAMAVALGLPVPSKMAENANMVPLGDGGINHPPKEEAMPDAGKEKDHHTAIAVEALGGNTDAIAVEIAMTRSADTADIPMIENAAIVTDPARDPAAETTTDVARTPAPEVAPAAKTRIIRDVDGSSGATRQH
ncbi:unnamed protein product [Penicillium bialowiezense]